MPPRAGAAPRRLAWHPETLATAGVTVGLGVAVAYLAWRSRGWPLIHDAPLMHYLAWRIAHGAAPYRDLFDMNAPGVHLVHLAVLTLLGPGDVAWRLFDLGWLTLTALGLAAFVRPFGTAAALLAALLFALYHLAGGPWLAGQRDFLLCVSLLGGAALVGDPGRRHRLFLGGLVAGVAVTIKPPAALFVVVLVAAATYGARGAGASPAGGAALVAAGSVVAPLACAAWLVSRGAWGAFVSVFADYVGPLYSKLGQVPLGTAISWWPLGYRIWTLFAVLMVAALSTRSWNLRRWLALGGILYGIAHFLGQGKGWEYHVYPLAAFACAAAGLALAHDRALIRWVTLVTVACLTVVLASKGIQELQPNWIAGKAERVAHIVADLKGRVGPTDTVQVLDTGEGGIHALYRLGIRQPTRFIYDFHFFWHHPDRRVIRELRAELLGALRANPPKFVVMLSQGWPSGGYDRIERFPELAAWLAAGYALEREGAGYRIYARQSRPSRRPAGRGGGGRPGPRHRRPGEELDHPGRIDAARAGSGAPDRCPGCAASSLSTNGPRTG